MRVYVKQFSECLAQNAGTGICSTESRRGRFCSKHWGQYKKGIISKNGKKLRAFKTRKGRVFPERWKIFECLAKNAETGKCSKDRRGRFCGKHKNQYRAGIIDMLGKKLRDIKHVVYVGKICIAKNAGTGKCSEKKVGRFCHKHRGQFQLGIIDGEGNKLRDFKPRNGSTHTECIAKNAGTGKCRQYRKGHKFHACQCYTSHIIDRNGKKIRDPNSNRRKYRECMAKRTGAGPCSKREEGRFCTRHLSQYYHGIITWRGKKKRDLKPPGGDPIIYKECLAKSAGTGMCTNRSITRALCSLHRSQLGIGIIDRNYKKVRTPTPKSVPLCASSLRKNTKCAAAHLGDCGGEMVGKFCNRHKQRRLYGIIDSEGNKVRQIVAGPNNEIICAVPGCGKTGGRVTGYCADHYTAIIELGHFELNPKLFPVLKSTMKIVEMPAIW